MCGQAGLEAAADALSTQLWGGRTLADLAGKAGVDLQAIRDAVDAACLAAQKDVIEQAVENGRLSQAQADWLLEGLEQGFLPMGRGFGLHLAEEDFIGADTGGLAHNFERADERQML